MAAIGRDELVLIRHAPADHGGRMCGRTDVAALVPPSEDLAGLRARLEGCDVVTSPARRCRETAAALFPHRPLPQDDRLWEQDFGQHEGLSFAEIPDLGPLALPELAQHRPPGGESFADMAARVTPALMALAERVRSNGPVAVIAHAGTVRTGLGLALGQAAMGLAFEVAPLSMTRLRCFPGGVSIISTNLIDA